jgi:hypothetical protein
MASPLPSTPSENIFHERLGIGSVAAQTRSFTVRHSGTVGSVWIEFVAAGGHEIAEQRKGGGADETATHSIYRYRLTRWVR